MCFSLTPRHSDIYQDSNQVLFKMCPGLKDVPCDRTVHLGQSDDPRCPLHLTLPPPMYQPEQEPPPQEQITTASRDMYLSAAELQPTESLPLEFSDVRRHDVHLLLSSDVFALWQMSCSALTVRRWDWGSFRVWKQTLWFILVHDGCGRSETVNTGRSWRRSFLNIKRAMGYFV